MNVKLLRKVKRHILAEPKRLYMSSYIRRKGESNIGRPYARCGTAACIAGWTCILALKDKTINEILATVDEHSKAQYLLGLSQGAANILFLPESWPRQFYAGVSNDGKAKTAKIAAARIEHFIKTKGKK